MTAERQEIAAALRASFLYPALGPAELAQFAASARRESYRAGEVIFRMGDPGLTMMIVEAGEVRISYPAPDGRTATLNELGRGAVFGEIALIDGGERSADAVAATNCTLIVFERRVFLDMLRESWPLTEAVLKLICARLRRADQRMADLAFSDLPHRLAKLLIARAKPTRRGSPPRVSDSQSALATLAGGSRENVNRWLRKWQREGMIAIAEGRIALLDRDGLARLAGG